MIEQKVYYKKVRDFGQVFGASFGYIKQNFRSFFGSILIFTFPFIALITVLGGYLVSYATSRNLFTNNFTGGLSLAIFLIFLFFLLVQTVYVTVMNEHLILNEQLPQNEFTKTGDIGKRFFGSFWRVLGNGMLLGLIGILFLVAYALVNSLFTALFASAGTAGIIVAALLQMATSLMISPIVAYIFISSMFVVQRDKIGVVKALGNVLRYLKGNFWRTWCVSVAGYLMVYLCSAMTMIPAIIFMMLQVFSRVKYTDGASSEVNTTTIIIGSVIFLLTIILILCVYSVYFLICNFQYSSLEEKKEGHSIMEKINQIQ